MIYYYECVETPKFHSMFTVIRNTTWEIANTNHKLFHIENGCCKIKINNKEYILNKGDTFYIPANTPYIRSPLNDELCEIFSICFNLNPIKEEVLNSKNIVSFAANQNFLEELNFQNKLCFLLPNIIFEDFNKKAIEKQILKLKSVFNITQPFNLQATSFALCNLLTEISNISYSNIINKPEILSTQEYPEPLKKAITYIKDHYSEPIRLDDLCKASFISKQMIIRYFNKHLGKSPLVYITEYKIDLIKSLLISSNDVSIKEICVIFGFDDQCYFSRIFKKYTGKSPKEYRDQFRPSDNKSDDEKSSR